MKYETCTECGARKRDVKETGWIKATVRLTPLKQQVSDVLSMNPLASVVEVLCPKCAIVAREALEDIRDTKGGG